MEAQNKTSKKRKQSSTSTSNSNPFSGILTRHKSQKFFVHHNRSGRTRSCSSFPSAHITPVSSASQRLVDNVSRSVVDDDKNKSNEIDHVSIKDLRARRVFSKPPKSGGADGKNVVTDEFDSDKVVGQLDESGVKFDGNGDLGENPSLSVIGKCDSEVKFDDTVVNLKERNPNSLIVENCVDLDGGNPNLGVEEGFGAKDMMSPNLRSNDLKSKNGDENVQTTPPDAAVLVTQIKGSDSRSPPKRISSRGGNAEGKKGFSNSKRSLVLNPCSRLKVYKAPNSFSYRRLLPFLMDLAKESPSAPKVNHTIKIETDVEQKPVISSSIENVVDRIRVDEKPVEIEVTCEPLEMNIVSKEEEKVSSNPETNDFNARVAGPCTPINCPNENEKSLENPVIDESVIGTPVPDHSKNGEASLDRPLSFDKIENLEDISPTIESDLAATTLHTPKSGPELSKGDATLNIQPSQLSLDVEGKCSAPLVEFKSEKYPTSVFHSASKLEGAVSPDEHGLALANGILKKNPRGCRGVCNCLSCSSFRLNAEKAFEFSRNQWLDAEEMAMDLMKELSNIRCTLEKSIDGADDNAIVPVDQVLELCKRASAAEDIARCRLTHMNEDLYAHCRTKPLQRPRVNFSSSVQKKITKTANRKR